MKKVISLLLCAALPICRLGLAALHHRLHVGAELKELKAYRKQARGFEFYPQSLLLFLRRAARSRPDRGTA